MKYNEDMVLSMIHEDRRINEKIEEEKEHIDKIDSLYEFIQELVSFLFTVLKLNVNLPNIFS